MLKIHKRLEYPEQLFLGSPSPSSRRIKVEKMIKYKGARKRFQMVLLQVIIDAL